MSRGRFITFEGGDGCGKTTQGHLLAQALQERGLAVERTREPGGTDLGDSVRKWLLEPHRQALDPKTELLLFEAARAELVAKVIRPKLQDGIWVVSDRFFDSTTVYQAMVRGLDEEFVRLTNAFVTQDCVPDLTLVLDVPAKNSLKRAQRKQEFWDQAVRHGDSLAEEQLEFWELGGDRIERESMEFHEKVLTAYRRLAKAHPNRVKLIDGSGEIEDVQRQCWRAVGMLLTQGES